MHKLILASSTVVSFHTCFLAAWVLSGGVFARSNESTEDDEPKAVEVKVADARLTYVPVEISARRRNARSEALLLKKADALFSTKRPLTYRRKRLAPGPYRITVEQSDEKRWFAAFWPDKPAGKDKENDKRPAGSKEKSSAPRPRLRVPLSLKTIPRKAKVVQFALKSIEKGKRLRIEVTAGGTRLTAALRWGTD